MKYIKITIKAIYLALKEGEFMSAIKLLNINKNADFIDLMDGIEDKLERD